MSQFLDVCSPSIAELGKRIEGLIYARLDLRRAVACDDPDRLLKAALDLADAMKDVVDEGKRLSGLIETAVMSRPETPDALPVNPS